MVLAGGARVAERHAAGTPATPVRGPAAWASQVTGFDVSYPQCGEALPSGQAFGIVAVNEGLPNNTNPCVADEISWAQVSAGGSRQPRASLYVNTADPGNHGIADWPVNNTKVGIYSTPKQWDPLVGTVKPGSPLYRLPDWIPGARTLAQAKKNCRLAPLTGGGTVTVTQWKTKPANSDFSCR
jgi:hypothetical protein